jgi:AcrR family transcriptional regulator
MAPKPRTVPRKQPQQARSRATIDVILTATARILVKEGFDRASTNRIAEAAGVSVGSLYQYFPSKEALVAALIQRHTEEMTAEISSALERVGKLPLAQAVREMVELMLRAHAVDPELHKVLIEQVPRVGRLERLHDVEANISGLVRAYLELHRSELRVENLDLAAFVVVTTVEALTHSATLYYPARLKDAPLCDEITALVVRYLQP